MTCIVSMLIWHAAVWKRPCMHTDASNCGKTCKQSEYLRSLNPTYPMDVPVGVHAFFQYHHGEKGAHFNQSFFELEYELTCLFCVHYKVHRNGYRWFCTQARSRLFHAAMTLQTLSNLLSVSPRINLIRNPVAVTDFCMYCLKNLHFLPFSSLFFEELPL